MTRGDCENSRKITYQIDDRTFPLRRWRKHDPLNKRSDQLRSLFTMLRVIQRFQKPFHFFLVARGNSGLEERGTLYLTLKQRFQLVHSGLDPGRVVLQQGAGHAVQDRLHQFLFFPLELCQFRLVLMERCVMLACQFCTVACIFLTEDLAKLFIHQVIPQRAKHCFFKFVTSDRLLVVACPFITSIRAADASL
nr:hypothetical protein [Martelella mediterranea]